MKTSRFYPKYGTLAVLTSFLFSAVTLQAQTFNGQQVLSESPSSFEAAVYPLSNRPSTIKVIFNNPMGGLVRVMIRNQEGKVFYDESEGITKYRRSFDLTPLPEGSYTVVLSKHKENFTQAFSIKPPAEIQTHIALLNQPYQKQFGKQAEKKLIVRQE